MGLLQAFLNRGSSEIFLERMETGLENARGGLSRDQKRVWSMFVRVIVGLRVRV